MKLITLLISRAALSQTAVEAAVNKAKKKEMAKTPGIPWERKDLIDLKGKELSEIKIEEIAQAPGVWKEYIAGAQIPSDAKRNLMKALEYKYVWPLRRNRRDKILTAMSWEAAEILWDVEVLINPHPEVERIPRARELHESMIFRKFERLEALRIF